MIASTEACILEYRSLYRPTVLLHERGVALLILDNVLLGLGTIDKICLWS